MSCSVSSRLRGVCEIPLERVSDSGTKYTNSLRERNIECASVRKHRSLYPDFFFIINFDGREVEYDNTELDEITLAYATTIHKAQGSEFPIVVIPLLMTHYVMLQRNLIYTGITRAKRICVLVGSTKALGIAVRNQTVDKRNTCLKERLL